MACHVFCVKTWHYGDIIMSAMVSVITGVSNFCSAFCSGAAQRKHYNSASMAFVRGIHRWRWIPFTKGPVTQKMFLFADVIIISTNDGIMLIGSLSKNRDIWINIQQFSYKKLNKQTSSAKWLPFCIRLNVSRNIGKLILNAIIKSTDFVYGNGGMQY